MAFISLLACSGAAMADTAPAKGTCDADCVAVGQWQFALGIGAGVRLNPLTDADDTPLFILPEVSYYGRRFFLRNLDMGFTLVETDRHQLNLLATPSYDQMYFNRWDPLNVTFAGGAGSVAGTTAAGPTGSAAYTSINISSSRTAGGEAASPSGPSDTDSPAGSGDGGTLSVTGSVSADVQVEINGTLVSMSSQLLGNEGNIVNVRISDGLLSVDGISASDQLALSSAGNLELKDISGDLQAATMDVTGAERITVTAARDAFIVNAQSRIESNATQPVPYDAVKKRRLSGLAGVEYSYSFPWASLHVQALQDFTNIHHGQELRLAAVIPLNFSSHKLAFTLGANHKSRKVLDYYYGVDATEVGSVNAQYSIRDAGTETLVRLDWQKPVSDHWTLRAKVQYLGLPSQVTLSPLVAKDYVLSAFIGGVYHF